MLLFLLKSCGAGGFQYEELPSGIAYSCGGLQKRITFYGENIVGVTVLRKGMEYRDSSLVVIAHPVEGGFEIKSRRHLLIRTSGLTLQVNKKTGAITFNSPAGELYLQEDPYKAPLLIDTVVSQKNYLSVQQFFRLSGDEGIYGLGQFQKGTMNYRNRDQLLVQSNVDAVVPFLISTNNYGILWDNYSRTEFHDGEDGTWFKSDIADQLDYYFVSGENMDEAISCYRKLSGKVPMFSKKAFGFWQCKERYTSFEELNEVVDLYRENRIPLDNIVQDWRYWGDDFKYWNSMYFKEDKFPEPKKNIKQLHEKHVNLMVSIWPKMGTETGLYKELEAIGALLSPPSWTGGKVYDAYNPEAREIYWKYILDGLISKGVDALWMDGTEPEFGGTINQETFLKGAAQADDIPIGPFGKYLNSYSLVTTEGVYEGHRAFTEDKRVFILTRSAWAGQQRNASVTWSGDVHASYDILRTQITAGINFSMAGIPYWTHDIGGFHPTTATGLYAKGIDSPAYRELYVRWFQFGAFTPIFRSHGTGTPRETWRFKERDPLAYRSLLEATELRYRLIPYIYSTAWMVTDQDYTMMRGLMMDFPDDRRTHEIADQYMFGKAMMVKPVTRAMYSIPDGLITEIIPSENLRDRDGEPGLTATYFRGIDFGEKALERSDPRVDFNWSGGGTPGEISQFNFSVRWEGTLIPSETGLHKISAFSDDAVKLWIGDSLVINDWWPHNPRFQIVELELEAGKPYPIRVEYYQKEEGSVIKLAWVTPSKAEIPQSASMSKMVDTYLPEHVGWYDFWSNIFYEGGAVVRNEYPLDRFPLFVKAGSIIPMGPVQQYIGEIKNPPLEIYIYAGADASFTYFEDEGDNYNYEKGAYNSILFEWENSRQTLRIGNSRGSFEGFIEEKNLELHLVSGKGTVSKSLEYQGQNLDVVFK